MTNKPNNKVEEMMEELKPKVSAIPDFMEEKWEGQVEIIQMLVDKLWESQKPAFRQALTSSYEQGVRDERERIGLEKAEQQICGFYHCYQGYDISSLILAMGLTKERIENTPETLFPTNNR